jgi:ATP-dependent protease ClpP protease subunit
METKPENDYKKVEPALQTEKEKSYTDILQEYDTFSSQKDKRKLLLEDIEKYRPTPKKKVGVIGFIADEAGRNSSLSHRDIPAIGSALMSLGSVDVLRLIINSPGGDGIAAEKIVEMCRSYCKRFEVIIPNMAKSAATLIALGADEIHMGYCSEIGPIDAQVPIIVDGIPRYISAQSFINARKCLLDEYDKAIADNKDTKAILQQIATLNIPFIKQCEKYQEFSRDMAGKYLSKYMFKRFANNKTTLQEKINKVLQDLSSTETFIVHGRMINAQIAKSTLNLEVKSLGKDEKYWTNIWEYYVRADIGLGGRAGIPRHSKIVETKNETLIAA